MHRQSQKNGTRYRDTMSDKMKTITLQNTGEQKNYHSHFTPFICTSDIEMPKMYNQGYNSYRFVGGEPNFIGKNMPEILVRETANYLFYECQIQVVRKDGSTVSGNYSKSVNKNTNESIVRFNFD